MLPQADYLSDVFRRHCAGCGYTPLHLPSSGAASEEQLLQELIACREGGDAALSLALIQLAEHHGWTSPWLDDNKARAELALGKPELACAIWETLTASADENVAAIATSSLRQLRRSLRLQNILMECCRTSGWQPRHLGNPAKTSDIGLGQARLEIIECRDRGATQLSEKLIEQCEALGYSSPWLLDNRARLLQARDPEAATTIWSDLLNDADPQVRHSAQLALDQRHRPEPEDELERAISDARDRGLSTPWRPLLLRRLLEDDAVESACWRQEATQLPHHKTEAWDLHLRRHRLFHALVDEQLNQLEQTTSNR